MNYINVRIWGLLVWLVFITTVFVEFNNVALEQNDPEETMGKAVALEEIGMDNDEEKGIRKNDLITIEQN